MGTIYCWYVPGGTIKRKIHENGDSVSGTHTDDFINFTTFHNRKQFTFSFVFTMLSFCWFYLELVSPFSLIQFLLLFLMNVLGKV